jgi:tetratricopeptide (TPR) repeat protein
MRGRSILESAPVENCNGLDTDELKEEVSSSTSSGHKEKKRIFFVTKSLAEVYAKQGHVSIALEIYRKMLEANPSDNEIEKRIAELQSHLSAKRGIISKKRET